MLSTEDRASLADSILSNQLFTLILDDLEKAALDRCVNAALTDHDARAAAACEVRAIRAFRSNCRAALDNNRPKKGAPA